MFLRHTKRKKDGKEHRYWSIVENRRIGGGRVVQRPLLYLGEINDSQELAWRKSIAILEEGALQPRTLSLFPEDRCEGLLPDASIVRLRLNELRLCRPRQWGGCWLVLSLWRELELDCFWGGRLPPSRKGTRWDRVLLLLATYRLLAPGSEWRLHREWFERSAMADLLGEDLGLAEIHKLYRCHDRLLEHKQALFDHLVGRWRDLFNISFDVLLYDLTSTYFEADPPFAESDKRRHGYSRDHRPDCVQVVIALVVTPEGLPLAYEVLPGNTAGSGANSQHEQTILASLRRVQARSTAFHTAGAARPWTRRCRSPNCPFRMRCSSSMPAIVIAAFVNPLKPSNTAMRCFTPRWSCSIWLFRYFDERSFVSAASEPSAFSSRTARWDAA